MDGHDEAIQPTEQGWLWSQQIEMYLGIHNHKLRFFTPDSALIPSLEELAEQECWRAEQDCQQAEQERQRAEQAEQAEQELEQLKSQLRAQRGDAET